MQYFLNENKLKKEKFELKQLYDSSITAILNNNNLAFGRVLKSNDSAIIRIKDNYDTSSNKIITAFGEGLGKYGYKFDSTSLRLTKLIRDSAKTTIVERNTPTVQLCGISVDFLSNDRMKVNQEFCSLESGSSNFNFKQIVCIEDTTGKINYLAVSDILNSRLKLNLGVRAYDGFNIGRIANRPLENIRIIYMHIIGTYSNSDNSKQYPFEDLYFYNIKSKNVGSVFNNLRKRIIDTYPQQIKEKYKL